jgi:drug/metabolite transporter (DMT)-like permease
MTRPAAAAFVALALIWGCTYLLIKVAVDGGVPPASVAFFRVAIGAALLVALAGGGRTFSVLRGRWGLVTVFAVLDIAVPFVLIAMAERHVSSSLTAVALASSPLLLAGLALGTRSRERPTPRRAAGLVAGFAGVAVLVGLDGAAAPWAMAGLLAAAAGCAAGPLIFNRGLADVDATVVMGGALVVATIALAPLAAITTPAAAPSPVALAALAALGVLCTGVAYVIYGFLIRAAGAGRAVVVMYLNPLVAMAVAIPVLGERPTLGMAFGTLLILPGTWLATAQRARLRDEALSRP